MQVYDNWNNTPGAAVCVNGTETTRERKLLAWAGDISAQRSELRRYQAELSQVGSPWGRVCVRKRHGGAAVASSRRGAGQGVLHHCMGHCIRQLTPSLLPLQSKEEIRMLRAEVSIARMESSEAEVQRREAQQRAAVSASSASVVRHRRARQQSARRGLEVSKASGWQGAWWEDNSKADGILLTSP